MKKFFFSASILLSIFLLGCNSNPGNSDGTIDLKFNLPKGSGYDYNMDLDMNMKGNMGGRIMNANNKMSAGYHFGVIDDSSGWKKVESTISRIAMNVDAGGVGIDYDSDKPVDSSNVINGTIGKVLGAMKGSRFTFTMNEKGEVGSITGINEMMQKMMDAVPGAGPMAENLSKSFNEENFKQNIQQAFGMYPGKPIKQGDTWTNTMITNNNGVTMKLDNTYKLESVNGDNANVTVNSKITSPALDTSIEFNGTMNGKMQYDIPTGVPVDGNLNMKLDMNIHQGGQNIPMNTDISIKITGKKS